MTFRKGGFQPRVAIRDIHSKHVLNIPCPHHGKRLAVATKRHRINRMQPLITLRQRGPVNKPTLIQHIPRRLTRPREMPALIPDLNPRMIATPVRPERCSHKSRRNSHSPAGIHQQNRQTSAGCQAGFHTLQWTLVRFFSSGGITHIDHREHLIVQQGRSFRRRLRVLHQRCKLFQKLRTPAITSLIHTGVRQQTVKDNLFRKCGCPGRLSQNRPGQSTVLNQKLGG